MKLQIKKKSKTQKMQNQSTKKKNKKTAETKLPDTK